MEGTFFVFNEIKDLSWNSYENDQVVEHGVDSGAGGDGDTDGGVGDVENGVIDRSGGNNKGSGGVMDTTISFFLECYAETNIESNNLIFKIAMILFMIATTTLTSSTTTITLTTINIHAGTYTIGNMFFIEFVLTYFL